MKIPSNYQTTKKSIIGIGSELKNTIAIKKENIITTTSIIDTTYILEGQKKHKEKLEKLKIPDIIAFDKHPSFFISAQAKKYAIKNKIQQMPVQHHMAHAFAAAIEHNLIDFLAITADGLGYGDDDNIWGGEVFHNTKRIGHLEYQNLIGGDVANKEPVRMLIGILAKEKSLEQIQNILTNFEKEEIKLYYTQAQQKFNAVKSSSCGRLLDCISILLGVTKENEKEGHCAIELEKFSNKKNPNLLNPIITKENKHYILQTTPLIIFIAENLNKINKEDLAACAHYYVAKGFLKIAKEYNNTLPILFTGGCAFNNIISNYLKQQGALTHKELTPGDPNIAIGQIAYTLYRQNH